jgi:hypothetical protein
MYETFRMLGEEREAEFQRHAHKWRRAAEVRAARDARDPEQDVNRARAPARFARGRVGALLLRVVGARPG